MLKLGFAGCSCARGNAARQRMKRKQEGVAPERGRCWYCECANASCKNIACSGAHHLLPRTVANRRWVRTNPDGKWCCHLCRLHSAPIPNAVRQQQRRRRMGRCLCAEPNCTNRGCRGWHGESICVTATHRTTLGPRCNGCRKSMAKRASAADCGSALQALPRAAGDRDSPAMNGVGVTQDRADTRRSTAWFFSQCERKDSQFAFANYTLAGLG